MRWLAILGPGRPDPGVKGTGQRFQVNMRGLIIHVPIDAASLDSYSPVP